LWHEAALSTWDASENIQDRNTKDSGLRVNLFDGLFTSQLCLSVKVERIGFAFNSIVWRLCAIKHVIGTDVNQKDAIGLADGSKVFRNLYVELGFGSKSISILAINIKRTDLHKTHTNSVPT
jgi:hypothetical protein